MNYQFQEGAITLPDEEYQDNSLNMLRFPTRQGSISITRDVVAPEITSMTIWLDSCRPSNVK